MRALVVEKRPQMSLWLEDPGLPFTCTTAADTARAASILADKRHQLVLFEFTMVDGDALAGIRDIRQKNRSDLPYLIIVNCSEDADTMAELLAAGADDIICAPLSHNKFKMRLHVAARVLTLCEDLNRACTGLCRMQERAVMGGLIPGLAHEMNNPLGFVNTNLFVMQGYTQQLLNFHGYGRDKVSGMKDRSVINIKDADEEIEFLAEEIPVLLDECREGLERLQNLVGDMQQCTQEDDSRTLATDINTCLDSVLNVLWNRLKYRFATRKDYGEELLVRGGSGRIHRLFLNLIDFLSSRVEGQGELQITTGGKGDAVEVSLVVIDSSGKERAQPDMIIPDLPPDLDLSGENSGISFSAAWNMVQEEGGSLAITPTGPGQITCLVRLPAVSLQKET